MLKLTILKFWCPKNFVLRTYDKRILGIGIGVHFADLELKQRREVIYSKSSVFPKKIAKNGS